MALTQNRVVGVASGQAVRGALASDGALIT
jgi:hypothetical protein